MIRCRLALLLVLLAPTPALAVDQCDDSLRQCLAACPDGPADGVVGRGCRVICRAADAACHAETAVDRARPLVEETVRRFEDWLDSLPEAIPGPEDPALPPPASLPDTVTI